MDETKERGYIMVAALLLPTAAARQSIKTLVMPGQRRIHFHKESDSRRKQILDAVMDLSVHAMIYDARRHRDSKRARDACLTRVITDLIELNVERVVLEIESATVKSDKTLLHAQLRTAGLTDVLR